MRDDERGLVARLEAEGYTFFTGVPDRAFRRLLSELADRGNVLHVPATAEAEAVALAAGAEVGGARSCIYLPETGVARALDPLLALCGPWGVTPLLLVAPATDAEPAVGGLAERLLGAAGWRTWRFVGAGR